MNTELVSAPAGTDDYRPVKPRSKQAAVLRVFLEQGDAGMNCFQSVELARDYVLRSTVSQLIRHHGITFYKRPEAFNVSGGYRVDCIRYSLTPDGAALTRRMLDEIDRGAA